MNRTAQGENRFEGNASRYAAYLQTPEGRLRTELTFANLQDLLPEESRSWRALDLGCGTGTTAVRLARLGMNITLLDSSSAMLDLAKRTTSESGVYDRIEFKLGDATKVSEMFRPRSFVLVLCHNLLEYVDDPTTVLRSAAGLMRKSSAIVSVLVRNQAGEVLKAALHAGDLAAAENNLVTEWGTESLYGGKVRFFTPEATEAMLREASLAISARMGVRVLSDYLPANISRTAEYERIFSLERKLSKRQEYAGVARYLHWVARGPTAGSEQGE